MIRRITIPQIVCSGSAGASTGTGVTAAPVSGTIRAVHLNHGSGAATTDVTVATTAAPTRTILYKADSVTDAWFYPKVQNNGSADGAAISGAYDHHVVNDYITVSVAQANDTQTLDVTLIVEE